MYGMNYKEKDKFRPNFSDQLLHSTFSTCFSFIHHPVLRRKQTMSHQNEEVLAKSTHLQRQMKTNLISAVTRRPYILISLVIHVEWTFSQERISSLHTFTPWISIIPISDPCRSPGNSFFSSWLIDNFSPCRPARPLWRLSRSSSSYVFLCFIIPEVENTLSYTKYN